MRGTPRSVQRLRRDLREGDGADLRRRRAIVACSLVSAASMAVVSLLQMGLVRHLPDPPVPGFDSDRVNTSDTAYRWGGPDGPLGAASAALNLPLAAYGGADRAREQPWVPLAAAGKAAVDAVASAWYFYQMPAREKAWCGYCIVGALANAAVFALSVPEAVRASRVLRDSGPAGSRSAA
jgi:uncharacterized membrane protein